MSHSIDAVVGTPASLVEVWRGPIVESRHRGHLAAVDGDDLAIKFNGSGGSGFGAEERAGGLLFPGSEQMPDYFDFAYFSFVIGMTCQVSDVQITSRGMRRLALVHSVLSFGFNTVILALLINTVSSFL